MPMEIRNSRIMEPEKESLFFQFERGDVSEEMGNVMDSIKEALTEDEKLAASQKLSDHILSAQQERTVYKERCQAAALELEGHPLSTEPVPPASQNLHHAHYTFDFAQSVLLPSHCRQEGVLYFRSLYKVNLFGICNDGRSLQTNYIFGEEQCMGKDGLHSHSANSVVSMLHHYFASHGEGERTCFLNADNCGGQNKNQLAENMLFHWKAFPIILPPSITDIASTKSEEGEIIPGVNFKNLFIAPTFDELDQVALDSSGVLKKLSEKQLKSVWDSGEFEVESINFPGQNHKWRLTQWLQKGSLRARDSMLNDLALSLRLLIITARNRFVSNCFSISQAGRGLAKGFLKVLDILIGIPSTNAGDLQGKIQDEHMRYLVAELDIKPSYKKDLLAYCNYMREKCEQMQSDISKDSPIRPPPIPYNYQTPSGLDIDLRLFNKDLINNCLPILSSLLDRAARGWHVQYRQKLIRELQGKGLSSGEISKRVTAAVMDEYLDRVFSAICNHTELENLQQGIGKLLVAQAKTVLAMKKAARNIRVKMIKHKEKLIAHLKSGFPIQSRIQPWMDKQIAAFETDFIDQNLWSAHEEAISICEEENLKQAVYFLKRDLNFIKERETVLVKELSKVRYPNRKFTFSMRIWLPKNYMVIKKTGNRHERIPTVIHNKDPGNSSSYSTMHVSYTVEKHIHRVTSTRYPFWRWWNFLHRTWTWMWNSIFLFGIVIPWCSPFSLRALFYIRPFIPDTALNQIDGSLYPASSSTTQTLCSRLSALWEHVSISRDKFEATPDQGFLGKSFTRHINRFWNFVLKGAFGTVLLMLVFPVSCIVTSTFSLIAALSAPLWVPVATLGAHISFFLLFDIDCPDESNKFLILFEAIIWRILMQGLIQPLAAAFTGTIVCPLGALAVSLFGCIRRAGRGFWDTMMFYMVVKSRGRVPSKEGFVARRIAGPGLASNYFYQIKPEMALAALEAQLELDELEAWKSNLTKQIELPKEKYGTFVEQCFLPFSADVIQEGVYKKLCQETSNYLKDMTVRIRERESKLNTGLHHDLQRRIKLPEQELKMAILQAAKMLEKFYIERVFPKLTMDEEEFWDIKQLEFRDWRGLACKKLREVFSETFLMPLEETNNHFQLEVQHINITRYIDMLAKASFHDDLDLVTEVHTPSGEVNVKPPELDIHYFDPSQVIMKTTNFRSKSRGWKSTWKAQRVDMLQISLPIPHPANIAVFIYNRDHDQNPINLDDAFCQRIIRATKEM